MKLSEYRRLTAKRLEPCAEEEAAFEADCIIADVLGCTNSYLAADGFREISEQQAERITELVDRRLCGEPVQYVLGKWEFYGNEFFVGKGVLIPRPETEMLVDLARFFLRNRTDPVCFDLCAGSGCIGISVAKAVKNSRVMLLEKSPEAAEYLSKNIGLNETDNCTLVLGDLFDGSFTREKADIILSNPPYIVSSEISGLQSEVQFEPHMALDGGEDGLIFYRCLAEKWKDALKDDGMLAVEIGNEQGKAVSDIFSRHFTNVTVMKDVFGNDRVVTANKQTNMEIEYVI